MDWVSLWYQSKMSCFHKNGWPSPPSVCCTQRWISGLSERGSLISSASEPFVGNLLECGIFSFSCRWKNLMAKTCRWKCDVKADYGKRIVMSWKFEIVWSWGIGSFGLKRWQLKNRVFPENFGVLANSECDHNPKDCVGLAVEPVFCGLKCTSGDFFLIGRFEEDFRKMTNQKVLL